MKNVFDSKESWKTMEAFSSKKAKSSRKLA